MKTKTTDQRVTLTQTELTILRNAMRKYANELRDQFNKCPDVTRAENMGRAIATLDKLR